MSSELPSGEKTAKGRTTPPGGGAGVEKPKKPSGEILARTIVEEALSKEHMVNSVPCGLIDMPVGVVTFLTKDISPFEALLAFFFFDFDENRLNSSFIL